MIELLQKVLTEENDPLWKDNPQNPRLRFKKIHAGIPMVWVWVGSFNTFKDLIGPQPKKGLAARY